MATPDKQELLDSLKSLPRSPGVYLMKDADSRILYIGKAIDLRSRVRSYFSDPAADRIQIPTMVRKIDHIDWIATTNETEALILEANLVREQKPQYNVELRDDKHYPYLKVTLREPFPRLIVTRRVVDDGSRYFGPYTEVRTMRRMRAFARKIFKIRNCNRRLPAAKPQRPCLNYSMGWCAGACGEKTSREEYAQNVALLCEFLQGRQREVIAELGRRMEAASKELAFERAAEIRDQLKLLAKSPRYQRVDLLSSDSNTDVFGFDEYQGKVCLCVLSFRQGVLLRKRHFVFSFKKWTATRLNPESLLLQFYRGDRSERPDEIILPADADFNEELVKSWFSSEFGKTVGIVIPKIGKKLHLIEMAKKNARLYIVGAPQADGDNQQVDLLKEVLGLPHRPTTIEAFDISNLGESFAVAGMVRFTNGRPDKSQYRRYKMKTVQGQNDFAMMMETVVRRLSRLTREEKPLPDLLLIDGGKGQLSAAACALSQFEKVPMLASLAKKEELLFVPHRAEPVRLEATHPARRLVERIRDEVHRWAVGYHRKLRGKQYHSSSLEKIPGIGPAKTNELLKTFGSIRRLKEASVHEIAGVKGFSESTAAKLLELLSE